MRRDRHALLSRRHRGRLPTDFRPGLPAVRPAASPRLGGCGFRQLLRLHIVQVARRPLHDWRAATFRPFPAASAELPVPVLPFRHSIVRPAIRRARRAIAAQQVATGHAQMPPRPVTRRRRFSSLSSARGSRTIRSVEKQHQASGGASIDSHLGWGMPRAVGYPIRLEWKAANRPITLLLFSLATPLSEPVALIKKSSMLGAPSSPSIRDAEVKSSLYEIRQFIGG